MNARAGHFAWQLQLRQWSDLVDDILVAAATQRLTPNDARVDRLSAFCRTVADSSGHIATGTLLEYWLARALGWSRADWSELAREFSSQRPNDQIVPALEKLASALHTQHRQLNRRLR